MPKWRTKLYKTDRARDFDHERDRQVRARQVYETIDRQPFQWMVVLVAGIGFFLDGYTLFASNIALPMIAYVYWNDEVSHSKLTAINTATLAGTILGQVLFGLLADARGRKKMYGLELVVLIMSTLGVVMSSTGQHQSMSIFGWLVTWRLIVGIGVGGDYPLSAVIASEFAPTVHRARMLACVFFMQPLGQIASNLVSIIVISITRRVLGEEDLLRSVDIMWRWIIGIGVFPGILAIILRFTIPETPRFTLEIQADPIKAEFDTTHLYGDIGDDEDLVSPTSQELEAGTWKLDTQPDRVPHRATASIISIPGSCHTFCNDDYYDYDNNIITTHHHHRPSALATADWTQTTNRLPTLNSKWTLTRRDIYQYFIRERNYLTLLGTSLSWLVLDFSFYGIGLSSPHFLAKTWGSLNIHGGRPPWQTTDDATVSVYTQFLDTSMHSLVVLNLGSFLGGLLLILTINRLDRVALQRWGFLALAALFVAMGTTFLATANSRSGPVAVSLYIVAQLAFNFGPNATTYILPAELFPTRYRATCLGINAAAGKLGSIIMQLINDGVARSTYLHHHGSGPIDPQVLRDERAARYAYTLLAFSVAMVLGFGVSLLIPRVQVRTARKGGANASGGGSGWEGEKVTFVKKVKEGVVSALSFSSSRLSSKTLEELSLGRAGERSASYASMRRTGW